MRYTLKLHYYSINIYNNHHSTCGILETDKNGRIIACLDLNSCDGWTEDYDGNDDKILHLAIDAANKAIESNAVPVELPANNGDSIVVASVEHDGNCADVIANYKDTDEDD